MKKYLQTLALLLCSLTASAYNFEVDGFCYNTISYTEVEVTYRGNSCTEYHNEYTGAVTIPATVTYNNNTYRVTSIGDEAFYGCWGLTTITIPKRVTSIGSSAFYGCSNLTTITIRENSKLTSIGEYAFLGCSNLTDITLPESVISIGKSAFYDCSSLTSITLPENSQLTSIGSCAFYDCSSLTSITLPESVTSIEYDAFYGCSSLTAVHISSIEAWCNIDFGDSYANPLSYAKNLYIDGELVTELAIPNSVTAIKDDAFSGCSSLTAITIPEGVKSIGDWAFRECSSLTSITIPENVTSIGERAFSYCSALTTINIPEGVKSIEYLTFFNCSSLTSIILPEGVTSIGESAFKNCSSLTSINIPESVTSIGESAFNGCSSLTSINIPESVTSIGDGAFSGCDLNYLVVHATNLNIEKGSSVKVAKLLVPEAALDFYQNSNWKNYCQSIESIEANLTYAFISNPSFEGGHYNCDNGTGNGDLNAPGGWQVNYTKADWGNMNFRPLSDGKGQDGNQYFEFWADTYRTLDLSQKLHSLPPGKYVLSAAMRTEQAEQVTNQHIYAKVGDITYTSATLSAPIGSAWDAVDAWQTLSVEFTLDKAESIVIGATSTGGAGSKGWFQIDNFQLGFSVSNISLNQTSVAIDKGETLTLTATVSPDNAINKTLTWTSSNSAVATVDSNGKVTGVGSGTAIITAKAGSRIATCVVTVEEKTIAVSNITLSKNVATLVEGEALTLIATVSPDDATDKTVTWSSSNESVATVDNNGVVAAVSVGAATITAQAGDKTATCMVEVAQKFITVSNITLSHTEVALTEGETLTLKATVSPDDATDKTVTWSTSDATIATVDNNGVVAAVSVGTATIIAKAGDKTATCMVAVAQKFITVSNITLSHTEVALTEGETLTLKATVSPDDATYKTVTWSSSNESVATVDNNGVVAAVSVGTATITAKAGDYTATCMVAVVSKGLIANPSFEGGTYGCDNGTGHGNLQAPEGWKVTYTYADWGWKNFQLVKDGNQQDGDQYFELWGDTYHTVDLSQELKNLPAGTYCLSAAMRTERADQVTNQHIYVKVNGKEIPSAVLEAPKGSAWNAVDAWQTLTVIFTLDAESDVVIGATSTGGAGSAGWFQIDNFRLDYSKYGEYYLYHAESKRFLSRGEHWGACATVDRYGIPFVWTAEEYSLKFIDSNVHLFETDDSNIYTDNNSTGFAFEEVEGGYLLKSQKSNRYLTIVDAAFTHDIVNVTDDASAAVVWQLKSKAEHDAIVAGYVEENYMNVIKAAGLTATAGDFVSYLATLIAEDKTSAIGTARFNGSAGDWTFTEVRHQDWQPAYGADFCELWQATGSYTQTLTGLAEGIYKVTVQGFERSGWWDVCVALGEKGYEITTATLSANGEEVNLKSWLSGKTDENNPDNTGQAIAKFNEGKYMNEVYTYVGADGTLTLTVCKPSHVGGNWIVFNNFTLTRYADREETGVEKTTDNSQHSTVIYDLTGRRVEKAVKGIYIVDGKKILVK